MPEVKLQNKDFCLKMFPRSYCYLKENLFLKLVSEEIAGSAAHNSDECSVLLYVRRDHKDYKDEEPRAAPKLLMKMFKFNVVLRPQKP